MTDITAHKPRAGSLADRAILFMKSIEGRPIKKRDLADQMEAPPGSLDASMNLPVQYKIVVRIERDEGSFYALPGCDHLPMWEPGVQRFGVAMPPRQTWMKPVQKSAPTPAAAVPEIPAKPPAVEPSVVEVIAERAKDEPDKVVTLPQPASLQPENEHKSRFMCSLWNDGRLEIWRDGRCNLFNAAETRQIIRYLRLFSDVPMDGNGERVGGA